jgi:hypothetical protein
VHRLHHHALLFVLATASGCVQLLGIGVPGESALDGDGGLADAGADADPTSPADADPTSPPDASADAADQGGELAFRPAVTFLTGGGPAGVALVDLNHDGRLDLVVSNASAANLALLANTTANDATEPSFATPVKRDVFNVPESIAVGDLDHDGRPDLLVGSASVSNTKIAALANRSADGGVPSFAALAPLAALDVPASVAIADLNGDGKPDAISANRGSDNVSVFVNATADGADALAFPDRDDFAVGDAPATVAVGDLNGDGKPELVLGSAGEDVLVLLRNTTNTAHVLDFAARQDVPLAAGVRRVVVGDVNGDGKPDLIAASILDDTIAVLLNQTPTGASSFTFAEPAIFPSAHLVFGLALADLDGDGRLDLVTANQGAEPASVSIYRNTGASFAPHLDLETGGKEPFGVAVGDLNGDGRLDLAVTNRLGDSVAVLLRQ